MTKLIRLDEIRIALEAKNGFKGLLFANEKIKIEKNALDNFEKLSEIKNIINENHEVIFTPDFHKGSGVPIGTVLKTEDIVFPSIIGNDIGCGMSLFTLDLDSEEVEKLDKNLDNELRYTFFEGGRNIVLSNEDRKNILLYGVDGINFNNNDLYSNFKDNKSLNGTYVYNHGMEPLIGNGLIDWLRNNSSGVTRDSFMGTVGGGNHFCELQFIDEIVDKTVAWNNGFSKRKVAIMVHSGSLDLGRAIAMYYNDIAIKGIGNENQRNIFSPLKEKEDIVNYMGEMAAAVNFASVNRLSIALMVVNSLKKVLKKDINIKPIYDLPHNFAAIEDGFTIHRKGACPTRNKNKDSLVIIPGSMGTESWILKSGKSSESIFSAPHGAGRVMSRNAGRAKISELEKIRVVTKLDYSTVRNDIKQNYISNLAEEAPSVYKDIIPVIETVEHADIANKVIKLKPILTIKG